MQYGQKVTQNFDLRNVAAIILGGGRGARLLPLTQSRCKPAICFGGKYRLIDVPISNALNAGCNKIFVLTQFLSSSLHRHILRTYDYNSFSQGFIDLLPAEEKPTSDHGWFQGTADAVRKNLSCFMETATDYFLVLSGDQLYHLDFRAMFHFAQKSKADLTIATLEVCKKSAPRMGIMQIDDKNSIVDFIEKPEDSASLEKFARRQTGKNREPCYLASMGIYLFKRELLFQILKDHPGHDFGRDLIPTLVKQGKAKAYIHKGYWEDIGTIESFYQANISLTKRDSPFNLYDRNNPIFSSRNHLPGPKVHGTRLSNAIVCEGSVIDADVVEDSVLGPRTFVGAGSVIQGCYLMGNDYHESPMGSAQSPEQYAIGAHCVLKKVIVDKRVKIGNHVHLTNEKKLLHYDSDLAYIREGIIVIPRGVTLPDGYQL